MQQAPAVSVIIPTCDRPDLLRVALASLAWQSFTNFEAVVVNDGETDISAVLAEFADRLNLVAVEHSVRRMGISAARNTGIRLSRGEYLVYLDDDDFFYKEHLECLHKAVKSSQYKVVYTDGILAEQELLGGVYDTVARHIPTSEDFDPAVLAQKNITPVLTLIHEKSCLRRSLTFAPYLRGHEDWDLWQRMGRHYRFRHMPYLTAEYTVRMGAASLSTAKSRMAESWLFVRQQGLLHSALPPVYALEERAAKAISLGQASGPCRASVILSLGRAEALEGNASALHALERLCNSTRGAAGVQLILAGAGSGMPELYRRFAPRLQRPLRCVCNSEDVGRVLCANQAASLAEGEWLVFLEPGVEVCDGWLDSLLGAAGELPGAGALGGVVEAPRIGSFAGGKLDDQGELRFNRLPRQAEPSGPVPVECLSGLCLMVRREHFAALGGFNAAFAPGHYADADLCLRLRQQGFASFAVPQARLLWNRDDSPLSQSPAGLVSRRAFWDSWVDAPFSLSLFTSGAEWSMRPASLAGLFPSDGLMPESFEVELPPQFR